MQQLLFIAFRSLAIRTPAFPFGAVLVFLLSCQASAADLTVILTDVDGSPIQNAVVEISAAPDLLASYQATQSVVIDQVDKEFVPHVSVIAKGGSVSFPNSDDILHHVYSFSSPATFNIPLYGKGENSGFSQQLPEAGLVEIGCNIHDWMLAYIYVAESTLAAVTDENGLVSFELALDNEVELKIWHPRLVSDEGMVKRSIELSSDSDQSLSVELELETGRRVRRAPSSSRRRYR